jgi:hypothetical protein
MNRTPLSPSLLSFISELKGQKTKNRFSPHTKHSFYCYILTRSPCLECTLTTASISMQAMATLTTSPLPITVIPTRSWTDPEAIWEERCRSWKTETGLNVLSLLELEGMSLPFAPSFLMPSSREGLLRGGHVQSIRRHQPPLRRSSESVYYHLV